MTKMTTKAIREAKCVECGEPIGNELYHFTKRRCYATVFIHKRCYEKLLPKKASKRVTRKQTTILKKFLNNQGG